MFDFACTTLPARAPDEGGTLLGVVGVGASHVVMAGGNTGKINKPAKVSGLVGVL